MLIFPCVFIYLSCCNKIPLSAGGCDRRAKRSREEPPHVRGQGWKLGGPHARRAVAKRSYPTTEVRGSGREYQTAMAQERLRGATPRPRSGGAAERRYPASESGAAARRSYPTPPRPRPGAAAGRSNLRPRPGAVARRTNPTPKEPLLRRQAQEGLEELSQVESQKGQW